MLERIWQAGIPSVEFFCARQSLDYHNKAQIAELRHWFRDSPLELFSLHAPMYRDDVWGKSGPHSVITITETIKTRRVDHVDEIKRALEIAEQIPFRYMIQHIGSRDEEFDLAKVDAAFTALEELKVFASQRGVEVLLENIPNGFSSSDRLGTFLELTHLDLNFCFDAGHAHLMEGVEPAFARMKPRIRSTHLHDNNGEDDDHLFPYFSTGGQVDWKQVMRLLRSCPDQYPLLLELRESPEIDNPLVKSLEVFERLENE